MHYKLSPTDVDFRLMDAVSIIDWMEMNADDHLMEAASISANVLHFQNKCGPLFS